MGRIRDVRSSRTGPNIHKEEETETILTRDDHIYAYDLDELMELFRAMQKIMEDLGFQDIHEVYSEHWETLPFKSRLEARKWKDPYTVILLDAHSRVKEPRSDRKTAEDIYKVKLTVKTKVIRSRYPHWEWFEETTFIKRSKFYWLFHRLIDNFLYERELEKYKEEAEELGIEFASQVREIEGTLPAIGRSKREYYNPHGPE